MVADVHLTGLVIADTAGLIQHWSEGAERLFGYSAAEAEGQSLDLIVPEAYRERHWNGFREAMRTGTCKMDRAATNLPVRCRDGEVRAFPARFVFLQDARNRVVGAMGIYSARAGSEQPFGPVIGD
jgi:PAS domain S-box-containing protein